MEDPGVATGAQLQPSQVPPHGPACASSSVVHEADLIRFNRPPITRTGFSRPRLWTTVVVSVWVILLLVIEVRVLLSPRHNSVVPIFTTASLRWLRGSNLYEVVAGFDNYRYSPLVAVLLLPFSRLPTGLGEIAWRLANAAIYLGALAWWLRVACPYSLSRVQRAVLFLLIIPMSAGSLNNGQCNPLVIGLLLAAMAGVAKDRWALAGGCVALACFFKLYPLAIGLLLVVAYPRRFAPRLALALAVGFLLPFIVQRPDYVLDQYVTWMHHLATYSRCAMPLRLQFSDLRLLCQVWVRPISPGTYLAAQLLSGAGIAGLAIAAQRQSWPRRRQLMLVLGLGCCWMLLLGPATESCTHILLAPSLAWALLENGRRHTSRALGLLWWVSFALMTVASISCWFPNGALLHDLGVQPLAVLLIFIGFVVQACQRLCHPKVRQRGADTGCNSAPSLIMSRVGLEMPAPSEELSRQFESTHGAVDSPMTS